jgi:hypothetical protein
MPLPKDGIWGPYKLWWNCGAKSSERLVKRGNIAWFFGTQKIEKYTKNPTGGK